MARRLGLRRIVLVLAVVLAAAAPAGVSAGSKHVRPCFNGDVNLNQTLGVSETIVWYTCPDLGTGLTFRVAQAWGMAATFESIPPGFVPAGATPLEDFQAKLVGRRVIIDRGTRHERVYTFRNVGDLYSEADEFGSVVNGVKLGLLHPLRPGFHTIDLAWIMSAMHCDGLIDGGCLMAGDNIEPFPIEIEVRRGHHH